MTGSRDDRERNLITEWKASVKAAAKERGIKNYRIIEITRTYWFEGTAEDTEDAP